MHTRQCRLCNAFHLDLVRDRESCWANRDPGCRNYRAWMHIQGPPITYVSISPRLRICYNIESRATHVQNSWKRKIPRARVGWACQLSQDPAVLRSRHRKERLSRLQKQEDIQNMSRLEGLHFECRAWQDFPG